MRTTHGLVALAFALLAPLSIGSGVVRVGPGGFATLQQAFTAAANGDVILIAPGAYAGGAITGKGLVLVADGAVTLTGGLGASALPPDAVLVLDGLSILGSYPGVSSVTLAIEGASHVRMQSCTLRALNVGSSTLRLEQVADVALQGCEVSAAPSPTFQLGRIAIDAVAGVTLTLDASTVLGGSGGNGPSVKGIHLWGRHGGHAVQTAGATRLRMFASRLQGGNGGGADGTNDCSQPPGRGGNGGDGLHSTGASTSAILSSVVMGGAGGVSGFGPAPCAVPDGSDGVAFFGDAPTIYDGRARTLDCAGLVREGAALVLHVRGVVGDRAYLAISVRADRIELPGDSGVVLIGNVLSRIELGTIDATGALTTILNIRNLPTGVDARVWHTQLVVTDSAGAVHHGSARVITVLDSAF